MVLQQYIGLFAQELEELKRIYLPEMLSGEQIPLIQRPFMGAAITDGKETGTIVGFFAEATGEEEGTGLEGAQIEIAIKSKQGRSDFPAEFVASVGSRLYLLQADDLPFYLVNKRLDISALVEQKHRVIVTLTEVEEGAERGEEHFDACIHARE
jgi:hypothetical protein